tara:strand:- start:283 stop:663 length:381 start_codon:yes stop_codon:yes gene_type:complete
MKRKPTSQAWQELVEQRQAQSIKNNELASNANHAHALENEQAIQRVRHEVNNARYKFKNRPYGKSATQRMANQGQLFKHQSFGYNDYCKFKRGLVSHVVEICGEPYTIMLPAKKGSGSRGSRSITK